MYQKRISGKCGLFIIEFGFSSPMERANTYLTDAHVLHEYFTLTRCGNLTSHKNIQRMSYYKCRFFARVLPTKPRYQMFTCCLFLINGNAASGYD